MQHCVPMAEDALSAAKGFHDGIGGWAVVSEQDGRLLTVAELPTYDPSESVDSVPANAHSLVKRAPSPAMVPHPSLQFTSGAVEGLLATSSPLTPSNLVRALWGQVVPSSGLCGPSGPGWSPICSSTASLPTPCRG